MPEQVALFLPQLVQLLRSDMDGMMRTFLKESAVRSVVFAHHLICTLRVSTICIENLGFRFAENMKYCYILKPQYIDVMNKGVFVSRNRVIV